MQEALGSVPSTTLTGHGNVALLILALGKQEDLKVQGHPPEVQSSQSWSLKKEVKDFHTNKTFKIRFLEVLQDEEVPVNDFLSARQVPWKSRAIIWEPDQMQPGAPV